MGSRLLCAALLALSLCVLGLSVGDYGMGWDESAQSTYGELTLDYFASAGEDSRASQFLDLHLYGALFEASAALLYSLAPDSKLLIRHTLVAIAGLFTVLLVLRLGSRFLSPSAGAFAALALVTMPRFYGHAFINSKDVPFAAAVAGSMLALLYFIESRASWPRALVCGASFGVALALRPGGAPLLLLLYAATLAFASVRSEFATKALLRSFAVAAVAWLVMIACWPWALQSPILHPLEAMGAALRFPTAYEVLFAGEVVASDGLPRSYFLRFLWMTTPPLVLLLASAGLILCAKDCARVLRDGRRDAAASAAFIVLLWALLPLISAALLRPNVYDGLRHILFVLPAIALLAGRAASQALAQLGVGGARRWVYAGLILSLAFPITSLLRLHPYQMTYFNSLAGGLAGASGRYETDYWVTSYREAAEWLNLRAAETPERRLRVVAAVDHYSHECIAHYLAPEIDLVAVSQAPQASALPSEFDFYVATTRYQLDRRYPDSPIAHEIGRDGAVFSVIRAREPAGRP